MATPQIDKLSPILRELWSALAAGSILCREVAASEGEAAQGGFVWFVHPSGRRVRKDAAEGLVRLGLLEPCGDALFPGEGQTYRPPGHGIRNG